MASSSPFRSRLRLADSLRQRGQAGFTILEVAFASFVMAFGICTSIITMQWGFRNIDVARGNTLASQILQSEIERLRLMSFGAISALPATQTVDLSTMFTSNPALAARFTVTRSVSIDAARPDVRYLTVNVQWNSTDGKPHSRTFTTMYAKNGLYDYYYTLAH